MERPEFVKEAYDPVEVAIYTTRYMNARPYVEGMLVLDVACGEGYGSSLMKCWGAKSVVGVDASREAIRIAGNAFTEKGLEFVEHDLEHLPFDDVTFDLVVSFETVEHVNDPEAFLTELRRVVKVGGTIIVSCPNDQYFAENISGYENPFHINKYSFTEFRNLSEKILGNTASWYMGDALAGFCNIPAIIDENIYDYRDIKASKKKLDIMIAGDMTDVLLTSPEKSLDSRNCLYYVGIWSERKAQESACVYPLPQYSTDQNKTIPDSTKIIKEWQDTYRSLKEKYIGERQLYDSTRIELEDRISELRKEYDELLQERCELSIVREEMQEKLAEIEDNYRILKNERDRLYLMNDMQKKEESLLWNQIYRLRDEKSSLQDAYDSLEQNYASMEKEKERKEDLIKEMENTRGWKILTIIRKVLIAFGWRRRKNASG